MLDPHLSDIVKMADALFPGKVPACLGLLGRLDILVGNKMVQHNDHPLRVKDPGQPRTAKGVHRNGRGDIIAQHEIQSGADQLPRFHPVQPCMGSKNFLCHGHAHHSAPSFFMLAKALSSALVLAAMTSVSVPAPQNIRPSSRCSPI